MGTMITGMAAGGSDIHLCPILLPTPPHGPGVVTDGSPTVLINHMKACRQGDTITEAIGPPNKIAMGLATVMIGNSGGGGSSGNSGASGAGIESNDEPGGRTPGTGPGPGPGPSPEPPPGPGPSPTTPEPPVEPGTSSLDVWVSWYTTPQGPAKNAWVTLSGPTSRACTTSEHGVAKFANLPAGEDIVHASATRPGAHNLRGEGSARHSLPAEMKDMTSIALREQRETPEPAAEGAQSLEVYVFWEETLAPIESATVSIHGPSARAGRTSAAGIILFGQLEAGDYVIEAAATPPGDVTLTASKSLKRTISGAAGVSIGLLQQTTWIEDHMAIAKESDVKCLGVSSPVDEIGMDDAWERHRQQVKLRTMEKLELEIVRVKSDLQERYERIEFIAEGPRYFEWERWTFTRDKEDNHGGYGEIRCQHLTGKGTYSIRVKVYGR